MTKQRAMLMLDDGTCFEGYACGACKETSGDVVFTTGMVGYQEVLSNPVCTGQIMAFTSAHVGNYGVNSQDDLSLGPRAAGAVFHDLFEPDTTGFTHWRQEGSLDAYLAGAGVTGITGVDTRALTIHLRDNGTRKGIISAIDLDKASLLNRAKSLASTDRQTLTYDCGCQTSYRLEAAGDSTLPVVEIAVVDFGVSRSLLASLQKNNFAVTVWPATTAPAAIIALDPKGVVFSSGPGNPAACVDPLATVKNLLGKKPLLGVGLGHELLGLALGAKVERLPFGHHGSNYPVYDQETERTFMATLHHSFHVDADSLPPTLQVTHLNRNNDTLAGMKSTHFSTLSVQFEPENFSGHYAPLNIFTRFRALIESNRA